MPSVKNFVTLRNGYGRVAHDAPLDDEQEADDVLSDGSSPRPERRIPPTSFTYPTLDANTKDLLLHNLKYFLKVVRKFVLTNVVIAVSVMLVVITISVVLGWYSVFKLEPRPVIDKSVKAFNIPNHQASRKQDALEQALADLKNAWRNSRGKRDVSEASEDLVDPDKLWGQDSLYQDVKRREKRASGTLPPGTRINRVTQAYRASKMMLIYLAKGEGEHNVFTPGRLETIHKVEMDIMKHQNFTDFCYINYGKAHQDENLAAFGNCAPLNTLLTYFYPSVSSDGKIHYDSLGNQLDDINRTLSFAMTRESFFWYVDEHISSTNKKSRLLRSEVHFGLPIAGYSSSRDRRDEQYQQVKKFIATYVDKLEKSSTKDVKVLYGGNEIFDYQIDQTFWNDLSLALYSGAFICVFMLILTSFSVWLTFWGIVSISLSFPLALFFYRVVFNNIRLGILNGVAAFVIIGIGVDDVFVFVNTFRQARHLVDLEERMAHTVWIAGKATFFTSFTTAAAFAANVASSIPAVHDFGLFMSLVVACCWIVVVLMMPPVLNIWYRCFSELESMCFSCIRFPGSSKGGSRLDLPADMVSLGRRDDVGANSTTRRGSSGDPDVPLLQIDHDVSAHEEMVLEADDPLLDLETELTNSVNESTQSYSEGCGLTIKLQGILYHGIALPVMKTRWYLLVVYIILLVVSIGLVTQLHPATKPPQLFKPDTNLQILMDLAANFSDDGITCDECSGFFKEKPIKIPTTTSTTRSLTSTTQRQTYPPRTTSLSPSTTTTPRPTTLPPTTQRTTTKNIIPSSTESNEIPIGKKSSTPVGMTTTTTTRTTTTRKPTTKTTRPRTTTTRPTTTTKPPRTTTSPARATADKPTPASVLPSGSVVTKPPIPQTTPRSIVPGYDPCANGKCGTTSTRPNLETGAAIYVVFGLQGIDRSNVSYNQVLTERGSVVYDPAFEENFSLLKVNTEALKELCRVCKIITENTELVKANGSQCIPAGLPNSLFLSIHKLEECRNLPTNVYINRKPLPARAVAGYTRTSFRWIAFAFESTTFKGQSSFEAYKDYQKWEEFIAKIKKDHLSPESPLHSIYQTSKFWPNVMMEIVAVSSAFYGLLFSMAICAAAVAVFTGHPGLLLIVACTIAGVILMVLAIFFLAGWEIGAVEAVSLSILVGSSVDYCVHLVEGYLLAGHNAPQHILQSGSNPKLRQWRTRAAITHIGVSILSSAVTTIVAAIPLTQTIILPFSKFGEIVAISTTVSIVYSLAFCAAFLALFAPAKFTNSIKSTALAFFVTGVIIGVVVLGMFVSVRYFHLHIPGPNGEDIFS